MAQEKKYVWFRKPTDPNFYLIIKFLLNMEKWKRIKSKTLQILW